MSKDLRESVSALMDGEASELELRRLLRSGPQADEVAAAWRRYHQQREAMHGDSGLSQLDISARVRDALASERKLSDRYAWRRALGGVAVAASVAAVVVFGAGGLQSPSSQPVAEVASPANTSSANRVYLAAPTPRASGAVAASTGGSAVPRVDRVEDVRSRERFERYLERHTERAALNSGQGMATYARLASHKGR